MKILLVTDAWPPQINGVANTLSYITGLIRKEHDVIVLTPYVEGSETLPLRIHNIPIVTNAAILAERYLEAHSPDRVHIATEGPLGLATRQLCRKNGIAYNTSYHTRLADYGWILYKVPAFLTWPYIRWFHMCSRKVLVTTRSITRQLGLSNCMVWGRGVDTGLFYPESGTKPHGEKTIITVGRVSKDKNLDDFCRIRGYRKILVGGGPYLDTLRAKYPDVEFTGPVPHGELRHMYAKADVFVFPSRLDTFGLVILEAMACGLPAEPERYSKARCHRVSRGQPRGERRECVREPRRRLGRRARVCAHAELGIHCRAVHKSSYVSAEGAQNRGFSGRFTGLIEGADFLTYS